MKVLELNLQNYKPYRDALFDFRSDDGHIHIVEGPQGAGKTSFHRAIQWVLYGDTPAPNYRKHLNYLAQKEDEPAEVELKLQDERGVHIIQRSLTDLDHGTKKAQDELLIIEKGETEITGSDAQDWINERIPKDLKNFFFLDGEEIQDRIEEGDEIKEDIETVLKHTAILNARNDLQTLLKEGYQAKRKEIEGDIDERDELNERIERKEDQIAEARGEIAGKEEELEDAESNLEDLREKLSDRNEALMDDLDELDEKIPDLVSDRDDIQRSLQESYEGLHLGILEEDIEKLIENLEEEAEHLEQENDKAHRSEVLTEVAEESVVEGKCLICGSTHVGAVDSSQFDIDVDLSQAEIQTRQVEIDGKCSTLKSRPDFDTNPSKLETKLDEINTELEEKRTEREETKQELGGISGTDKTELDDTITGLESHIQRLEDEIEGKEDKIDGWQQDIERLHSQKAELRGNPDLDEVADKIGVVESLLDDLSDIREEHIQRKREKIKEEMNRIFERVSRSEFIREKYIGVDFKGDPHEEDEYVLQLIKETGEPKDMTNREPSAGETQLTALSFIFGLNKYANYSVTIVFDTVAGRLDLDNSEAQGEFFASLEDPLILLVHDGELQKLRSAINSDIGRHYRLRRGEENNETVTTIEEVTK